MNSFIKRKVTLILFLIATFTLSQSVFPHRAHAVIGVATVNPIIASVGGFIAAGGFGAAAIAYYEPIIYKKLFKKTASDKHKERADRVFQVSAFLFLAGLVTMDEDQGTFSYQELSDATTQALGLSVEEQSDYNKNLPKIELLSQNVIEGLSQEDEPSLTVSTELWQAQLDRLSPQDRFSPETITAFQKVNEKILSELLKN